jgi:hypothetical protein
MNKTFFLPLIILFFTLYYFVFPWESSTEMVWTAAYCEPFEGLNPSAIALNDTAVINHGRYKAVLGKESGENFISSPDFDGYLSSSHAFYKEDDTLYLKEFAAYSFAVAKTVNSPLLIGDRYFSVDYGSSFIEEYDKSGSILWSWKGLAPLTALAWNKDLTVIGSLDGHVSLIDRSGQITGFPVYPADGDNVVYAVAVSGDSKRVAIISGLRNQYLRTYTVSDSPQLLSQLKLKSQYRRPVKMYYSDDAAYLWVEQEKGLLQYTDDNPPLLIPVEESFLTMRHDEEGNLIYILSRTEDVEDEIFYSLKSYSPGGKLLFQNKFEYFPASFQLNSADVLFSINDNLMILNRQEM